VTTLVPTPATTPTSRHADTTIFVEAVLMSALGGTPASTYGIIGGSVFAVALCVSVGVFAVFAVRRRRDNVRAADADVQLPPVRVERVLSVTW
jgi:hypothetical protein